nr:DEAD/DEAH box helicase [bacterium]
MTGLTRQHLKPKQLQVIELLQHTPKCALWAFMSFGKTVSTLTALSDLKWLGEFNRALVLAPLKVADKVWLQEIDKWEHLSNLSATRIKGSPTKREKLLQEPTDIHVVNHDITKWLCDLYPHHRKKHWPYDVVVIDEADFYKDHSTKRFKALKRLTGLSERVIELAGTPTPNGYEQLWPQLYLLDSGERLGRTVTAFRNRWFIPSGFEGRKWKLRDKQAEREIKTRISDICFTIEKGEVEGLPDSVISDIWLELPERLKTDYRRIERDFLYTFENGDELKMDNAAELRNKMLQFCNGFMFERGEKQIKIDSKTGDEKVVRLRGKPRDIHDEKLQALDGVLEKHEGTPVLIAYRFTHDRDRIKARYPNAVVMNEELNAVERWNNGEIPILLMHPMSGGHGLNLQFGGSVIVWFGLCDGLGYYQQMNARLIRTGQPEEQVFIYHLLTRELAEIQLRQNLDNKEATMLDLMLSMVKQLKRAA